MIVAEKWELRTARTTVKSQYEMTVESKLELLKLSQVSQPVKLFETHVESKLAQEGTANS